MCSKSCSEAFLEHPAELVPERLVQLLVLCELRELLEDLAHGGGADVLHDPVLLEDLAAHVQRQVLRVDDAAHEAQVDGQELLLALRDEHALDVQLHPGLVVVAVQVEGRRAGDVEERRVGEGAFHGEMDPVQGILRVVA